MVSPSRSAWSISVCLTQFLSELSETPSSLAIRATLLFGEARTQGGRGFSFELWWVARCCSRHFVDLLRWRFYPKLLFVRQPGSSPVRENRQPEAFDRWLEAAKGSTVDEMEGVAEGLIQDYEAVRAALPHEWSSGQTEGQINRLNFIKRQMYGRANFELLKARFLHAA